MGRFYAVYAHARLTVVYGPDGSVRRGEPRWKETMAPAGLSTFVPEYPVVPEERDW
jgi:hypothetical protein